MSLCLFLVEKLFVSVLDEFTIHEKNIGPIVQSLFSCEIAFQKMPIPSMGGFLRYGHFRVIPPDEGVACFEEFLLISLCHSLKVD
jgi:hypothetical protein